MYASISASTNTVSLNQVAIWMIGEYGEEIEESEMSNVLDIIESIITNIYTDATTLCMYF